MSRIEDNFNMVEILKMFKLTPDIAAMTSVLVDISQSLAVIADKMEDKNEHCTVCRRCDPDVD